MLVELAVFTGCRISELCNLTPEHVINRGGVSAIFIEEGKTSAATRLVHVTDVLGERLKELAAMINPRERLFGIEGKNASRWFSQIKTEHVSTDSAKSFHSFRVMFATAMQQAEVEELKAAAIIGHKRGSTMT